MLRMSSIGMQMNQRNISYYALAELDCAKSTNLIDIRPNHAYQGWKVAGEIQGGHVEGANLFAFHEWEAWIDRSKFTSAVKQAFNGDSDVYLYGSHRDDALDVASRLVGDYGIDTNRIHVASDGFVNYAANPAARIRKLPGYAELVHAQWLEELLSGSQSGPVYENNPETFPSKQALLFHCNYGKPEDYARGHIPGAVHLDTNVLETEVTWNRRTPEELQSAIASLGITKDTPVVLYGRTTKVPPKEYIDGKPGANAGQIAAFRAALILTYAGVKDVRVLDGGYDYWKAVYRFPVTQIPVEPHSVKSTNLAIPENPNVILDLPEARNLIESDNGELISIRSLKEFVGEASGYNYIKPRGDIAGAVFGDCGSDAYHMETYRNIDHRTMLAFPQVDAIYKKFIRDQKNDISFYCGTGWRASETWFYAKILGYPNASVYDGGWFEWSKNPELPVSTHHPQLKELSRKVLLGKKAANDAVVAQLLNEQ